MLAVQLLASLTPAAQLALIVSLALIVLVVICWPTATHNACELIKALEPLFTCEKRSTRRKKPTRSDGR